MKNNIIYKDIELALCEDFKVNLFMRMKNRTNNIIIGIESVEKYDYDNYILLGLDNGSKITFNCDDIHEIYIRR